MPFFTEIGGFKKSLLNFLPQRRQEQQQDLDVTRWGKGSGTVRVIGIQKV